MRPTSLGFRHPNEKTPGYLIPEVTYDGRKMNFPPSKSTITRNPTFPRAKRFSHYFMEAKRSNSILSSATYAPSIYYKLNPCLVSYVNLYNT